ncbi:MAG: preprotein translocase subunit SecE [Firmicutes bacterium HGW-Firmicutes-12]|jgi:preprotein translocase subunit SecE|nr:MAG: preprotein translocase subunit SecE [Firmicutes bacterium HGW-Firmicutes-12]
MSLAKGEKLSITAKVKKHYRGVVSEMKRVHWPNRKEIIAYTSIVLVSVVIVGVVIWVFDSVVGFLMNFIISG